MNKNFFTWLFTQSIWWSNTSFTTYLKCLIYIEFELFIIVSVVSCRAIELSFYSTLFDLFCTSWSPREQHSCFVFSVICNDFIILPSLIINVKAATLNFQLFQTTDRCQRPSSWFMFDISPVNCSRWRAPTRSSGGILGSGKWECNMYTERTKWVYDGGFYLCVLEDFPLRLIWLFFHSEGLNLELMCGTSSRGIWFLKRKKKNNKKNKPQLEVFMSRMM